MPRVIRCECGYVVEGASDDELLANAEQHIAADHPDLVGRVGRNDLLDMAEEA